MKKKLMKQKVYNLKSGFVDVKAKLRIVSNTYTFKDLQDLA